MTRKLNLVYVSIMCYNGRARIDFGCEHDDRSYKVRRVCGPTSRFSNIIGDINERLIRGRGKTQVFTSGWTYFPNRTRRHA